MDPKLMKLYTTYYIFPALVMINNSFHMKIKNYLFLMDPTRYKYKLARCEFLHGGLD